jgi:DNA-binding Lrp family transcriptional regulator
LNELKKVRHVKEAYPVYRVYDIVARVEAEMMDELNQVVSSKVRRLNSVRSTLTMVVVEGT